MRRRDYMRKLQRVLVRRRDTLRTALAGEVSMPKPPGVGDAVDLVIDSVSEEVELQLAEAESRELADIENALERFRVGQYGVCENCGNKITLARLKAVPHTTVCVQCRRRAENRGKTPTPPDLERTLKATERNTL